MPSKPSLYFLGTIILPLIYMALAVFCSQWFYILCCFLLRNIKIYCFSHTKKQNNMKWTLSQTFLTSFLPNSHHAWHFLSPANVFSFLLNPPKYWLILTDPLKHKDKVIQGIFHDIFFEKNLLAGNYIISRLKVWRRRTYEEEVLTSE